MKGFERATGDVLAWLNSDDVYLPSALAAVQKAFDQDPQLEILTGYMIKIDAESRVTEACRIAAPSINIMRQGFLYISQPTTFFKRSLFERVGKLDMSFQCAMDADLWCRFYRAKPIWKTLPRYVVGFRGHGDNKGLSPQWRQRYAEENRIVRNRYPEIKSNLCGLCSYRIQQILTGAKVLEWWHTKKFRHQNIDTLPNWLFDKGRCPQFINKTLIRPPAQ
jgi:hypothetical protein